jgi:hypothetical protein
MYKQPQPVPLLLVLLPTRQVAVEPPCSTCPEPLLLLLLLLLRLFVPAPLLLSLLTGHTRTKSTGPVL